MTLKKFLRFYRASSVLEKKLKDKKTLKILDVACGNGKFSKIFENKKRVHFFNVDIIENKELKNYYKVDLEKEDMPFKDKEFDAITGLEIIEHLDYPEKFLKKIRRILNDEGVFILLTPNIRFLKWISALLFKGVFPNTSSDKSYYDSGHRKYFTLKDLEDLADKTGFYVNEFHGLTSEEFYKKWRFVKKIFGKRFFVEFFCVGILLVLRKK